MRFLYNPWALVVIASAVFGLGAWNTPLFDKDEGAFAEATREMLESGQYLTTTLDGEPRHDKPILIYWAQALSVKLLGPAELAFRLPSILAALLWALALYRFTRQTLGRDEGGIATLSFVTALMVSLVGKWATADALLNLFIALTMFDAWRFAEHRDPKHGWRVYLWMALGFLTKGPIALGLPLLVGLPWMIWSGRLGVLWALLRQPAGWAAFVVVAAPWYIANTITPEGREFLRGFFLDHNLARYATTREGHGGVWWYYLPWTPLLLMPFAGWFLSSLVRLPRVMNAPLDRYLWLWFFVALIVFSLSATQLPHYLVYGMTPLFILFGRYYAHFTNRWLCFAPAIVFFAVLALVPSLLPLALELAPLPGVAPDVAAQIGREAAGWPYAVASLAALVLSVVIAMERRIHAWHGMLLLGLLQAVLIGLFVAPTGARLEQTHIRAAGQAAAILEGDTVVAYRYRRPSFSVYRNAVTPHRAPLPGEVVFTQAPTLATFLAEQGLSAQTLFSSGNLVLARVSGGDATATPPPPIGSEAPVESGAEAELNLPAAAGDPLDAGTPPAPASPLDETPAPDPGDIAERQAPPSESDPKASNDPPAPVSAPINPQSSPDAEEPEEPEEPEDDAPPRLPT
ncbi:MAG: glycosyltransferase family 39 protein [Pseudomonadota bacterium]